MFIDGTEANVEQTTQSLDNATMVAETTTTVSGDATSNQTVTSAVEEQTTTEDQKTAVKICQQNGERFVVDRCIVDC